MMTTRQDDLGYSQVDQWQTRGSGYREEEEKGQVNLPSDRSQPQGDAESAELPGTIQQPPTKQEVDPDGDVVKAT